MAHYDQFEAPEEGFTDRYNARLEKKYCLVPKGNTSDLFKKDTNIIDDALGFTTRPQNEVKHTPIEELISQFDPSHGGELTLQPRKHSKGKAEGARFCYLSSIAAASEYSDTAADYVGRRLDDLLSHQYEVSQQITYMMIVEYAALAIGSHRELFDGVIAVRSKALESGKYTQESWKEPIDIDLLLDAAARHLISYLYVGQIDKESGENHMCHIVANVLMIAQQLRGEQDAD